MNRLFKYKNGEIKVMWNEQPMNKDYEDNLFQQEVGQKTKQISIPFLLGVELKVYRGGRVCYGMLIARVEPHDEKDVVKISIAFTHQNTIKYKDSFLLNKEYVYKGLPKEYLEKVSSSVQETISTKNIYPQCHILFEYAANCAVGSSPMIFGIIAEIITNLICTSSLEELYNISIDSFTEKYVRNIDLCY